MRSCIHKWVPAGALVFPATDYKTCLKCNIFATDSHIEEQIKLKNSEYLGGEATSEEIDAKQKEDENGQSTEI